MQVVEVTQVLPGVEMLGRQSMQTPEEVAAMLRSAGTGVSLKRIAMELGCSRNTVRRYLRAGGWIGYRKPERGSRLAGLRSNKTLQKREGVSRVEWRAHPPVRPPVCASAFLARHAPPRGGH